jgi:hypothetical protein
MTVGLPEDSETKNQSEHALAVVWVTKHYDIQAAGSTDVCYEDLCRVTSRLLLEGSLETLKYIFF